MDEVINLLKSKLKIEILSKLQEEELTPLMLSKLLKRPRASVSRAVIELTKDGYLECKNPKDDRWRIYSVTKKGNESLKKVKRFK